MSVAQWTLSKGQTHYNHLMGAVFIALILLFVQFAFSRMCKLSLAVWALSYSPSAFLLTMLTCFDVSADNRLQYGSGLGICFIITVILILLAWLVSKTAFYGNVKSGRNTMLRLVWMNVMLMVTLFILVSLCGNTDRTLHARAHMERCIMDNDYDGALTAMKKIRKPDDNLTMLTALALSHKEQLGEKLFEYPVAGNSASLLPTEKTGRTLMMSENDFYRYLRVRPAHCIPPIDYLQLAAGRKLVAKPIGDYLLCAYLLDGNLNAFVDNLKRFYEINNKLPKHYQEALTLYRHSHSAPMIVFDNSVMDADFQDYQRLERSTTNKIARRNKLKDVYGNTYWYYYQYVLSNASRDD